MESDVDSDVMSDVDMMEEEEDEEGGLLPEIWLHILSFLPPRDLGSVAQVARGLGELATLVPKLNDHLECAVLLSKWWFRVRVKSESKRSWTN